MENTTNNTSQELIKLELSKQEIEIIMLGLGELPAKMVYHLINKIDLQTSKPKE